MFCFFFQHVQLFHSTLLPCMIWWVHCNSYLCSSIGKVFGCWSVYLFLTTFKVFSLLFYLCLSIPFGVLWTLLVHHSGLQLIWESSQLVLRQIFLVRLLFFASGIPVMHKLYLLNLFHSSWISVLSFHSLFSLPVSLNTLFWPILKLMILFLAVPRILMSPSEALFISVFLTW